MKAISVSKHWVKLINVILYYGGRYAASNILFDIILNRTMVSGVISFNLLYENFFFVFLFIISLVVWPTHKYSTFYIEASAKLETEIKRTNDLKERELNIQEENLKAMQNLIDTTKSTSDV